MAKRFAAVLLSVCMLIGMILPMAATDVRTVKKDVAFDSATNTATITLTLPGGTPPAMNVIFVLDNSKSMEAKVGKTTRMELAIEAAELFINSLTDSTKVSVIEFHRNSEILCGLGSKSDALAAVGGIKTASGTVYSSGLRNALEVAKTAPADEPVYVIFISDGEPYDQHEKDYLDAAAALHKAGAKVISVGIDVSKTEALKAVQNAGYYDAKNEDSVNGLAQALSSIQNQLTRISIVDDFSDKFEFVGFLTQDTAKVIDGAVIWDFTAAPTEERTCVYQIRYIGDKSGSVSVGNLTVSGPGYQADSTPAPTVNITFPPKVTGYTITITSADAQAMLEELNGQPLTASRASLTATKTLSDGTSADADADARSVLSRLGVTWEVTGSQTAAGKSKNTVVLKQNGGVITAPASLMMGDISVDIRVNEGMLTVMEAEKEEKEEFNPIILMPKGNIRIYKHLYAPAGFEKTKFEYGVYRVSDGKLMTTINVNAGSYRVASVIKEGWYFIRELEPEVDGYHVTVRCSEMHGLVYVKVNEMTEVHFTNIYTKER